jgi:hypothetical protein
LLCHPRAGGGLGQVAPWQDSRFRALLSGEKITGCYESLAVPNVWG